MRKEPRTAARAGSSADEYSDEKNSSNERLQKLLARAGIASRRGAEEFIIGGRVSVNGHVIKELGAKADPSRDKIIVDGKPLIFSDKAPTVLIFHKPRGVVTTKSDPEKRATVFDLLPKRFQGLHSIGRLDFDTAGVLLLTDDGDLTHLLTHPSHGVEKIYHARARGEISLQTLKKLEAGVWIKSGDEASEVIKTAPARAKIKAQTENNCLVEIALREGRNRQVRKMLDALGHPVSSLRRVSFAGVELEGLPAGAHRVLLDGEVHELRKRATRGLDRAQRKPQNSSVQNPSDKNSLPTPQDEKTRDQRKNFSERKPFAEKSAAAKNPQRASPKPKASSKTSGKKPLTVGERVRREWK